MKNVRVKVIVKGQVQGVGFRYFTQRTAESLNLAGWVRNRNDGAVEAELEGSETAVEAALEALRQGPDGAHVESLSSEGLACQGHPDGFHVRF